MNSLDEISTQSGKLAELVKNLRQLFSSRNYEFHSFSLHKACHEILDIVEPTLQSKRITLTQRIDTDPMVHGDAIQIQQVLINVFNNAIDAIATDPEGLNGPREIVLSIGQNEQNAVLRIEDSGTGIEPSLLPSIFELYKTTKQGGLGVGLLA
ncbi:sensor histidine kinase [Polynucleobacter necessarius]|uniref:sensor histidine kinase n=1 Tax=Polynucleobacter necessarius TaxID=576610 RepID=UPI000FE191CD|nr:ATP-binding protein [Polynucleobacter necessarius]